MKFQTIFAATIMTAFATAPAYADGFMTMPDIYGESTRAGHERAINIRDVSYAVDAPARAAVGAGRMRARATAGDFIVTKDVDTASPYIALASFQQKAFDEIEIQMTRPDSRGADRPYYKITLTNVVIKSVETNVLSNGKSTERVGFAYEEINILYTTGSGDEHEIEFDVVSGV